MLFTINYRDIELEDYWQIPINKPFKCAQGMLGVLDMITKLTLPILLINKLLREKILNLNFEVVFLKTLKHALNRFLHRAIQFIINVIYEDLFTQISYKTCIHIRDGVILINDSNIVIGNGGNLTVIVIVIDRKKNESISNSNRWSSNIY